MFIVWGRSNQNTLRCDLSFVRNASMVSAVSTWIHYVFEFMYCINSVYSNSDSYDSYSGIFLVFHWNESDFDTKQQLTVVWYTVETLFVNKSWFFFRNLQDPSVGKEGDHSFSIRAQYPCDNGWSWHWCSSL